MKKKQHRMWKIQKDSKKNQKISKILKSAQTPRTDFWEKITDMQKKKSTTFSTKWKFQKRHQNWKNNEKRGKKPTPDLKDFKKKQITDMRGYGGEKKIDKKSKIIKNIRRSEKTQKTKKNGKMKNTKNEWKKHQILKTVCFGAAWFFPFMDGVAVFLHLFGGVAFVRLLWVRQRSLPLFWWVVLLGVLFLGGVAVFTLCFCYVLLSFPSFGSGAFLFSSVGWCCLVSFGRCFFSNLLSAGAALPLRDAVQNQKEKTHRKHGEIESIGKMKKWENEENAKKWEKWKNEKKWKKERKKKKKRTTAHCHLDIIQNHRTSTFSPVGNKWDCWKSSTKSKRRNFSSILTFRIGWKMLGWFCGKLLLSAKCSRPLGRRENSVWKTIWRTIQRANNFFWSSGWIPLHFNARPSKTSTWDLS